MSPVNLGQLPSNEPVPTGKIQMKRAVSGASVVCPANNSPIYDGAGAQMGISFTTGSRPGWWVIRAENIFIIADAAWYWFAWYVQLGPIVDENGIYIDYAHHRLHSALGWQQSCIDTAFKLKANQFYSCTMYFRDRQAGTVNYFTGSEYCSIPGEFIGEGSI